MYESNTQTKVNNRYEKTPIHITGGDKYMLLRPFMMEKSRETVYGETPELVSRWPEEMVRLYVGRHLPGRAIQARWIVNLRFETAH